MNNIKTEYYNNDSSEKLLIIYPFYPFTFSSLTKLYLLPPKIHRHPNTSPLFNCFFLKSFPCISNTASAWRYYFIFMPPSVASRDRVPWYSRGTASRNAKRTRSIGNQSSPKRLDRLDDTWERASEQEKGKPHVSPHRYSNRGKDYGGLRCLETKRPDRVSVTQRYGEITQSNGTEWTDPRWWSAINHCRFSVLQRRWFTGLRGINKRAPTALITRDSRANSSHVARLILSCCHWAVRSRAKKKKKPHIKPMPWGEKRHFKVWMLTCCLWWPDRPASLLLWTSPFPSQKRWRLYFAFKIVREKKRRPLKGSK